MDQQSPQALLDFSSPAQQTNQVVPEVIVLPHSMVEPADMMGMADGIARKTEGNYLMNRPAQPVHPDIGKPIGEIGAKLLSKPVLGSENKVGIDPLLTEGLDRIPGNRQMPPLDERHIGCDDQNPFLFQRTFFKDLAQGFVGLFIVVGPENENGAAFAGRAAIAVIDIDDGISEEGSDFRSGANPVANFHGHHFVGLDFIAEGTECGFRLFIIGRQEQKMALRIAGVGIEGPQVDPGVGQSPEDPSQDAGLVRRQDVEFCFNGNIMHFTFSF